MNINRALAIAGPALTFIFIFAHSLALAPCILIFNYIYDPNNILVLSLVVTLVFFFLFPILLMIVWALFIRFIPKPNIGLITKTNDALKNILLTGVCHFSRITFSKMMISNSPFPSMLFYAISGSKIHPNTIISSPDCIPDPYRVTIGKGSIVGLGAVISGHFQPNANDTILGNVEIGENVLIGAYSLIAPDVKIGAGARILAQSGVYPKSVIGPKETWGGMPAKKNKLIQITSVKNSDYCLFSYLKTIKAQSSNAYFLNICVFALT